MVKSCLQLMRNILFRHDYLVEKASLLLDLHRCRRRLGASYAPICTNGQVLFNLK